MYFDKLKEKKIFVTGHTGFKGTWLSLILEYLGCDAQGYALEVDKDTLFNQANPKIKTVYGDIRDYKKLEDTIMSYKPNVIIHLASQAYVNRSIEDPLETFSTNVIGLSNLLNIAKDCDSIENILVITSDKCYKNKESNIPYSEDCELGAQDPYSTSKACQELISKCYQFTYYKNNKISISTARASNVVGCGDFNKSRLVPYLLDSLMNGDKPNIRNPHAIRPWQNVMDVLFGYLTLVLKMYENQSIQGAYNFGPDTDGFKTVEQLSIEILKNFSGNDGISVEQKSLSDYETNILKLDNTKAKQILGWKPIYTFEETIKSAVDFTKKINAETDIKNICFELIDNYIEKYESNRS